MQIRSSKKRPARSSRARSEVLKTRDRDCAPPPSSANSDPGLEHDLNRLRQMAFDRYECCAGDIRRFYQLKQTSPEMAEALDVLRRWVLCPVTLWPVNFHHLLAQALERLEAKKALDQDFLFLLSQLHEPPPEEVWKSIEAFEFAVESGEYDTLVPASAKFQSIDQEAALNPELRAEWEQIAGRWKPERFADEKGILRRTPSAERNLRPHFSADWTIPRKKFQAVFDLFCARWNLYGMRGNQPLVLKPSVNPTAFGTMIFIPAYWSLDSARDFNWKEIAGLHRVRSLRKQGAVLADGKSHRRSLAQKLARAEAEARAAGLKGRARHEFLCKALGWVPGTDPKRISRLKKEFPLA